MFTYVILTLMLWIVKCINLGNTLYNNIYKTKIDEIVCDFERRSNHIIKKKSMCDSFTLEHKFSTYCESLYGYELFKFTKPSVKIVYLMAENSNLYFFIVS